MSGFGWREVETKQGKAFQQLDLRCKKQEMGKRAWCVHWVNPCRNWHWLDKNTKEDIQFQGMDWQQVRKLRKRNTVSCNFSMVLKNTPSTLQAQPLQHQLGTEKLPFLLELISLELIFRLLWECCTSRPAKRENTNSKAYKGISGQKELLKIWFSALHPPTSKYPNLHSVHEKQGAGHLNIHQSQIFGSSDV